MINEREYMFASSFLKACDSAGTAGERFSRFAEAGSTEALHAAVSEAFHLQQQPGETDSAAIYEAAYLDVLEKVRSAVPDFTVFYPLIYKYDCTNVKIAVKAAARGIPLNGLLFRCGSVPAEKIMAGAEAGIFEGLPPRMEEAAKAAREAYGKTGEVRSIDLILDKACFQDMKDSADEGGVELIQKIVAMKADSVNTLASMRIAASGMPVESEASLMERAFVPGGELPIKTFVSPDGGCSEISEIAKRSAGTMLTGALHEAAAKQGISFVECEKLFDEAALSECDRYRFKPFGPEVVVRYLMIREAEVMNARLVEAGMAASLNIEQIKERLREAYV